LTQSTDSFDVAGKELKRESEVSKQHSAPTIHNRRLFLRRR